MTSAKNNSKATRTLTNPNHAWMLPPGNLQRSPYIPPVEQQVKQRVATDTKLPPPVIQCITDAPPIMVAPNQTSKCTLHLTKHTHMQRTRNNIPGSVPPIMNVAPPQDILILPTPLHMQLLQRSTRNHSPMATTTPTQLPHVHCVLIAGGVRRTPLISHEAINILTKCMWARSVNIFTPDKLQPTNLPTFFFTNS